jgi:hypothetical protein
MIIDQIDIESVSAREAENQTPIPGYGNAPKALEIAFQRMQSPATVGFHFFDLGSGI